VGTAGITINENVASGQKKVYMNLKQVFEKIDSAVQALVCNDAPLRERLDSAIIPLVFLPEKELPPDCRKEFIRVKEKIRVYHNSGGREDLQPDLALAIYQLLKNFIAITSGEGGFMPM
jgi:hypothetical protein